MVKIGWLADRILIGGTELSCDYFKRDAPDWVTEIVDCPADKRPPPDIDLFIVESCVTYQERWINAMYDMPVIVRISDQWPLGSCVLKRWLLDNAVMLTFNSPMHKDRFRYPFKAPWCLVPPPVDMERFRKAAKDEREGNVFIGRIEPGKGVHLAIDWALRTGEPLRIYGRDNTGYINWDELPERIQYMGEVAYDDVPDILGSAKKFVFFPIGPESFGRTVAEASAAGAGCKPTVFGDIGALWWLENRPGDIERASGMFWEEVKNAIH